MNVKIEDFIRFKAQFLEIKKQNFYKAYLTELKLIVKMKW